MGWLTEDGETIKLTANGYAFLKSNRNSANLKNLAHRVSRMQEEVAKINRTELEGTIKLPQFRSKIKMSNT